MSRTIVAIGLIALLAPETSAQKIRPARITVVVRGVITDKDAAAIRAAFAKIKGVKLRTAEIQRGEKGQFRHYFSPPFVIELADLSKTNIGGVAEIVSKTKTPSRGEIKPSLNLVLFHSAGNIGESDIVALRTALTDVNGVEAQATGGIGAVLSEGRYWVRLESAGGADLDSIRAALNKANLKLKLEKPSR